MLVSLSCILYTLEAYGQAPKQTPITSQKFVQEHVQLQFLDFNKNSIYFAPAWYKDGIIFVGQKRKNRGFFKHFFASTKDSIAHNPKLLNLDQDSVLHEGPIAYADEMNTLFFTRSNVIHGYETSDQNGKIQLQIFSVKEKINGWGPIKVLPFNADNYSCTSPHFDKNKQRLYFASNMPGGFGGYDLYYCDYQAGLWSAATNLGNLINSENDELYPFIYQGNTLIFSSNAKEGFGGFDFYKSQLDTEVGSIPFLLPAPFNSPKDDLGFIIDPSAHYGYFSSNRDSPKKADNIYYFDSDLPLLVTGGSISLFPIKLIDQDDRSINISNCEVHLELLTPQGNAQDNTAFLSDAKGVANIRARLKTPYKLKLIKEGYETFEQEITFHKSDFNRPFYLKKKIDACFKFSFVTRRLNSQEVLNSEVRIIDENTKIIYDQFAQGCLPTDHDYTVEISAPGYEQLKFFIPAKDLKNYYGENLLIELAPKAMPVPPKNTNEKLNYNSNLESGKLLELDNIYYETEQYKLSNAAKNSLDVVYSLMLKYPDARIEVRSHTDSKGEKSFNQSLSDRRAQEVRKYLMERGIVASRIIANGYGESQLKNQCDDNTKCSSMEHAVNRRTEIRVL